MSDRKRVIAAYQDRDGTYIQVLDDGAHMEWSQPDGAWVPLVQPLPPEALGEVASGADEIDVDARVRVESYGSTFDGCIMKIDREDRTAMVAFDDRKWAWVSLANVTKVEP